MSVQDENVNENREMNSGEPTKEEKTMALLAHILPIVVGFLAPLVIWLVKKDESAFIADQAKESLNFQISLFLYLIASTLLCFVFIGILLLPAVGIFGLVYMIIAAIKSNDGIRYRYPLCLRFIS